MSTSALSQAGRATLNLGLLLRFAMFRPIPQISSNEGFHHQSQSHMCHHIGHRQLITSTPGQCVRNGGLSKPEFFYSFFGPDRGDRAVS